MSESVFDGEIIRGDDWRTREFGGQRIAVIAATADAARIVPHVVRSAASVKVFQRSAEWLLEAPLPVRSGLVRRAVARLQLRHSVDDPWVRRQLTPDRRVRRTSVRPGYLEALQHPRCKFYTWPVYAVVEHGVRSAEGVEHRVDVIILGGDVEFASHSNREDRIA